MKRTPLYDEHVRGGGKMVEFAGWEMPVQYSGVIAEHVAVRTKAGIFDVSHMGEVWVTGPEATQALQHLTCNDISKLVDNKAQYSAFLNVTGGVIDDIIVYRFNEERYLICVNASNTDIDFAWIVGNNRWKAAFENASPRYGQIAVQGPDAPEMTAKLLGHPGILETRPFFHTTATYQGAEVIVARTGYTGEDGFEIFCPAEATKSIWEKLLSLGALPCGLGARDSLRLEAALPLHGHELGQEISALESGLGWIVKLDKGDFIGRNALQTEKASGSKRKLVGFVLEEAGIARQGDSIADTGGATVGIVTSGTKTPTVNKALGMALVNSACATIGGEIACVVRGRNIKGRIVPLPFYKRNR